MKNIFCFLFLLTVSSGFSVHAEGTLIDQLRVQLSQSDNVDDSIARIYDIFDLSPRKEQPAWLQSLYEVSRHGMRYDVTLDALRRLADVTGPHPVEYFDSLLELTRTLPVNDDRLETELFIKLDKIKSISRYGSHDDLMPLYATAVEHAKNEGTTDIYERIEALVTICILQSNTFGVVFDKDYFREAEILVEMLPSKKNAVKNFFYSQAAIMSDNMNQAEETVRLSKRLDAVIDTLSANYRNAGRIYRNYNSIKYINYRRMLRYPDQFTSAQIDSIFNKIQYLVQTDIEIHRDYTNSPVTDAYYAYAKKDYARALPILLQAYERVPDRFIRRRLLMMIREVATATGNDKVLDAANRDYIESLESIIKSVDMSILNELSLLYRTNDLKLINDGLVRENDRAARAGQLRSVMIFFIALAVLAVLVLILFRLVRKYRWQSNVLAASNRDLLQERQNLIKTREELIAARDNAFKVQQQKMQFISNISHELAMPVDAIVEYSTLLVDCVDAERLKYVKRYLEIILLNADLLTAAVGEMREIGELESTNYNVNLAPASVGEMCRFAVESVRPRVKPGVELIFQNEDERDESIVTDERRVELVLVNLLQNSARFTSSGSIKLAYRINHDDDTITFTVTDTGIGIPEGKEKVIFERFQKADPHSDGTGLGLAICAMIAKLLNGTIYVDQSVKTGSRFVFTIPL